MKKFFAFTMSAILLLSAFCLMASATEEPTASRAEIYVTVADKDGKLAVTYEKITVTDIDDDKSLTVNDALYCAHEAKYTGGAAAGYGYYTHEQYGLSLSKLWGDESGSFGYYVNNASSMGLGDAVKDGDHVYAFIYRDTETYSDKYSFFNVNTQKAEKGGEIILTLMSAGFDANWAPVNSPVEGATVTVNGVATELKTDAEGQVKVKLDTAGELVISATLEGATLVPPVCKISVASIEGPDEGPNGEPPEAPDNIIDVGSLAGGKETSESETEPVNNDPEDPDNTVLIVCVIIAVVVVAGGAALIVIKSRKS